MTSSFGWYILALATGFAAVFLAAYTVACVPAARPNLLGIRGLKRVRAMRSSAVFSIIEPGLRWVGMQIRRGLSDATCAALDRRIMLAGDFLGLVAEEFVAVCLLAATMALVVGRVYSAFQPAVLAYVWLIALMGGYMPYSRLLGLQEERRKKIQHSLPPVVDLLVLCLSAGMDLPAALRQVVGKSGNPDDPLIEELGFVLQELQVGKTRKAALSQFAERAPTEAVREFVGTVIQAEEHGNPLARVLEIHAEVSRQQRSSRAEEAAAKAGVKMTVPMVMGFLAVMALIVAPSILSAKGAF